jgi:hypothetical protein
MLDIRLILNINLYMEDERTGQLQFAKSVDIRSNTDESWRRGLDYLVHKPISATLKRFSRLPRLGRGNGKPSRPSELAKQLSLGAPAGML